MYNPNASAPKLSNALTNPSNYFELRFNAQAGMAYRLWIRGKAENNGWANDSVFVQFSGSVDSNGTPVCRIGTTSAEMVNLEDCGGCDLSGWGWQDNGYGTGVMGPLIYFQASGTQTIRVQTREDGLSIDQIVLSAASYVNTSPGALKNDTVILPRSSNTSQIVIWAGDVPDTRTFGNWARVFDGSAAGDTVLQHSNAGAARIDTPLANPTHYFEMSFPAQAGVPYRLWMRSKADSNGWANDSVHVQFSGSVTATGSSIYRIGTTSATFVNLEDCSGCGISGWGWQDNGWGTGVLGPLIYFQSSGTQTIRVQTREDGLSIDQIVLSSVTYLSSSPGALRNDTVILPSTIGGGSSPPPPPPSNQPPQVSASATPTSGNAPLTVSFNSTASDPDGSIASYSWVFGNGQTSSQADPSVTYQSAGTYTARVTVTDDDGATASASVVITVTSATSGGVRLKVMSWNIAKSKGTDGNYNLDRTATWIANLNPDLVALCEVMRDSSGDDAQQLASLLGQKTGRTWYWFWIGKYSSSKEGNLILSKHQILDTDSKYLSYQRSVAQVKISVNGRTVNFFATHLDPDYSSRRQTQINEIQSFLSGFSESRIIAGDFNSQATTTEMLDLRTDFADAWLKAVFDQTATAYPDNTVGSGTRTRRSRIDMILYSKYTSNLSLVSAQVPDSRDLNNPNVTVLLGTRDDRGVRPSDHNIVLATFDVR
jgi:endonuclease/exonuclease/phosphatase family metal-dependent hydrolase